MRALTESEKLNRIKAPTHTQMITVHRCLLPSKIELKCTTSLIILLGYFHVIFDKLSFNNLGRQKIADGRNIKVKTLCHVIFQVTYPRNYKNDHGDNFGQTFYRWTQCYIITEHRQKPSYKNDYILVVCAKYSVNWSVGYGVVNYGDTHCNTQ